MVHILYSSEANSIESQREIKCNFSALSFLSIEDPNVSVYPEKINSSQMVSMIISSSSARLYRAFWASGDDAAAYGDYRTSIRSGWSITSLPNIGTPNKMTY